MSLGVVADGMPAWLFLSDNLTNSKLKWLLLPENQQHWENLIPDGVEVHWLMATEETEWNQRSLDEALARCPATDVVVFEGRYRPPRSNSAFWKREARLIVTQRTPRGKPPLGWQSSSRALSHQELGGVTNWKNHFHVWTRVNDEAEDPQKEFWDSNLL